MASKSAILRLASILEDKLSGTNAHRLHQVLTLMNEDGNANLEMVLKTLFPRLPNDAAQTAFRQFRAEVKRASREAGVQLTIESDGQTRSLPCNRIVSFESENRIVEEVK